MEEVKSIKTMIYSYVGPNEVKNLCDTIEALQQENEQLKADCDRMLSEVQELTMEYNRLEERLQISPFGDDKIDELEQALEFCKHENEQLRAQVARMRDVLDELTSELDYAHLLKNGIEWDKHKSKTFYGALELLKNIPANYHNPADVELLRKARKALHKGISELKVHCKYFDNTPEEDACIMMHEAVIEIDKAIGGGKDGHF